MDHSEASYSWGLEALSCKSSNLSFLLLLTPFLISLALRHLLDQMNEHRNAGNANSALAQQHFRRFDALFEEFTSRLHRLASEDHPGALIDTVFNEEKVLRYLDFYMEEVAYNQHTDPEPAEFEVLFKSLIQRLELRPRIHSPPPSPSLLSSAGGPSREPTLEEFEQEVRELNDFIDDEAEEMPDGYESQPEQEEETEGESGSPVDEDDCMEE